MSRPRFVSDEEVIAAMREYGGSFVNGLGTLFNRADGPNWERLKAAFPEYWAEYEEIARKAKAKAEAEAEASAHTEKATEAGHE